MGGTSDEELTSRAALGDPAAIAELYDRHGHVLLGVALRIVGTRSEAEDALHDTFVSLPERARHYEPRRGAVIAWLIVLVRNVCLDGLRRRGASARLAHRVEIGSTQPDAERLLSDATERQAVRAAVARLPAAQRQVLEAAFFEGLTYSEIAARESLPLNTVKSRCARTIIALRAALANVKRGVDD